MTDNGSPPVAPRSQPKQSRSVETYNGVLEAAGALFAERGYEQTTTHQIASRAGISVGALYRYFADKEAICKELYRREISALRNRMLEEFDSVDMANQDVRELIRKTVALTFQVYAERPGLRRVLGEQSRKIAELAELRRSQESEIHQAVQGILTAAPGIQVPDTEVGAYFVTLFVESLVDDHIYRRGRSDLDEQRIVDAATDLLLRYALGRID